MKGIGEAATIGATPAVQNAVVDALSHLGVRHVDIPCTPARVHAAIRAADAGDTDPWREPPAAFDSPVTAEDAPDDVEVAPRRGARPFLDWSGARRRSRRRSRRPGDAVRRHGRRRRPSLTVERGTITAVLGPNGAGKTTTLETCEGYRAPQQGTVRVLGLDPRRDRRALLPRIGVMLQDGGAWSGVRAREMLDHVARLHAHPLDTDVLAERLGLDDCGRTPYRRLSGGQQQRLGLAMALVGRPELVFVDEPTAGMDPQARRTTWALLEELRADGVTVVLTTHYLEEAERLADQVHIIDRGAADRQRHAAGADPGRRGLHDPAGRHRAVPARRARVAARHGWATAPRCASSTS